MMKAPMQTGLQPQRYMRNRVRPKLVPYSFFKEAKATEAISEKWKAFYIGKSKKGYVTKRVVFDESLVRMLL